MGPFLQEVFMPIIHTILKCSTEPYDPRDEEVRCDHSIGSLYIVHCEGFGVVYLDQCTVRGDLD